MPANTIARLVPGLRAAGAEPVTVRYLALDGVDVLIVAVFLSTLVSRGALQRIWSHSDDW
jgi:hypothetical protein